METKEIVAVNSASQTQHVAPVIPRTFDEIRAMAEYIARSNLCPKEFRGRPADVAVCIMHGLELGLRPLQALRNIAVINGRPTVWGDAALALALSSPLCEYVKEEVRGEGDAMEAVCRVKRRGHPEIIRTFSVQDAKRAGLWGKSGPWREYPQRMLQMRARSWALRDAFPDLLSGLYLAEEAMDIPPEEPVRIEATAQQTAETQKPAVQDQKAVEELTRLRAQIKDLLIQAGLSEQDLSVLAKIFGPIHTVATARGVLTLLQHAVQQAPAQLKQWLLELSQQQDLPLTVKDAAAAWEAFVVTRPSEEEVQRVREAFKNSEFAQLMGQTEVEFVHEIVGEQKKLNELARPQLRKVAELLKVEL